MGGLERNQGHQDKGATLPSSGDSCSSHPLRSTGLRKNEAADQKPGEEGGEKEKEGRREDEKKGKRSPLTSGPIPYP